MVDKSLIMRKLSEIEEYLVQVREYSNITQEKYQGDWRIQRIIERTLQMMVEICADITGHLISDKGLRTPTSYADGFKVLLENGLIDHGLFQVMEKMAKFRNVIVHHYDKVDAAIVVTVLQKHLDDFILFRNAILSVLRKEKEG